NPLKWCECDGDWAGCRCGVTSVGIMKVGGVVLAPHVTDMRNGLFRSEVAFAKGKATDVFLGGLYDCRQRAGITAKEAAIWAVSSAGVSAALMADIERAIADAAQM